MQSATPARQYALDPLRSPWRPAMVLLTAVAAIAHLPLIGPHLTEAPYMGVLFIVLAAVCLALSGAAIVRDSAAVYSLVVVACGLAVLGYAATRLVAFPMLAGDVGDWLDPLGIVSICTECAAVAAALLALRGRQRVATV